tara:strand:+ start:3176 stop:4756 length:1581 start_codon:yes stop_codon:yes gene_type:complete
MVQLPDDEAKDLLNQAITAGRKRICDLIEGNGIHKSTVRVSQKEVVLVPLRIHCAFDVSPVIHEKHDNDVRDARVIEVADRDAMNRMIEKTVRILCDEPKARPALIDAAKAGDYGTNTDKTALLKNYRQYFKTVEPCQACDGTGKDDCPQCRGKGEQGCRKCHAKGNIPCDNCRGHKRIPGPNGDMIPCPECNARGALPCPNCNGRKTLTCQNCHGKGQTTCRQCGGSANKTVILSVDYQLKLKPEVEFVKTPPHEMPAEPLALLTQGDIAVLDPEPNTPAADQGQRLSFDALLPSGTVAYSLNGKRVDCILYGLSGHIQTDKTFLDSMVKPGIAALNKIVRGPMAATALFRRARSYRMIRDVTDRISYQSRNAVLDHIKKTYTFGISDKYARAMIVLSDKAIQRLTQRPRLQAAGAMTALWAVLFYIWFALGVLRGAENTSLAGVLDLMVLAAACFSTYFAIRVYTRLKTAIVFGVTPGTGSKQPLPRSGRVAAIALAVLCGIFLICAAFAGAIPNWLPLQKLSS